MASITVLIYTYNNETHIADCISAAKFLTDTIIVIDQNSTDKTVSLAKQLKARVVTVPHHIFVEPVRMRGISQVNEGWVMILDADERITPELAAEIKQILNSSSDITHYKIPRKNIFDNRVWLAHGGWFPDYQTRLILRSAIRDWPKNIHATPVITGNPGILNSPMLHYFHGAIEAMVSKTAVYESIESDLLYEARRASSVPIFFRKFLGELFRRLIKHAGWKDGMYGIIESMYQAYSKTVTYLFLYEKQKA